MFAVTRRSALLAALASVVAGPGAAQPASSTLAGRRLAVRDTHLWVEDYGPRDAPALLYIHGGPGLGVFEFSHYMRDLLSRDLRLILVDQRGVLRSDPWSGRPPMSLDLLIDDFEALRDSLGLERWTILGHSWGGAIALRYADRHAAVDRVIFENPVLDATAAAGNLILHAAEALDVEGRAQEARRARALLVGARADDLWTRVDQALGLLPNRQRLYVHDPAFLGYYGRISAGSGIPDDRWTQGSRMALALLREPQALSPGWNRMSALAQPTLLIRGETDPVTSPNEIAVMAPKPNVRIVTVPNAGHFVHVERPRIMADLTRAFVAPPPAGGPATPAPPR